MSSNSKYPLHRLFFIGACVLFWVSRYAYWLSNNEPLFSDMLDFDTTARAILSSFCFDFNPFFKGYNVPTVPALRALQILILGDSVRAWQFFQAAILFGGTVWLSRELHFATNIRWIGVIFIWTIVLSKPSLFWSLKLAREGIGEAMTLVTCASLMCAVRTNKLLHIFSAGAIFCITMLIRGSFIFALPFVFLILAYHLWRDNTGNCRRALIKGLSCFTCGLLLIWGPWIYRSIRLYGHPVLLSTVGPYVFFWDMGPVSLKLDDGSEINFTSESLQSEAPQRFANDYEAYTHYKHLMHLFVKQNLKDIPSMLAGRVYRTIVDRDVHLTKLSRHDLFASTQLDEQLLIDKSVIGIMIGYLGLLICPLLLRSLGLSFIFILSFIPWVNAAVMIGYSRMLESFIALTLFGNALLLLLLFRFSAPHIGRLLSQCYPLARIAR